MTSPFTVPPAPADQRARQKRILQVLGVALILGGLTVLLVLRQLPLPVRYLVGSSDVIGGLVLLLVARQKFGAKP